MEPYRRKVRYWDVDSNAHVFNARYLVYVDDALTDFFEEIGLDYTSEEDGGYLLVVAHAEVDFRGEAVIGNVLATTGYVDRIGNTSITFGFKIIEEGSGRTVATGNEVYVTIDPATRKAVTVPDRVRELLRPHVVSDT
jgi:acyl-CoA thioester hydrolase